MEYNQNKRTYSNSFYNDPIPSDFTGGNNSSNNRNNAQGIRSGNNSYQNNKLSSSYGGSVSYAPKNVPNRYQNYQNRYSSKPAKKSILERIYICLNKKKGEPNDDYILLPAYLWLFVGMCIGLSLDAHVFDQSAFIKVNFIFFILQYLLIAIFIFVPAFGYTDDTEETIKQAMFVSFFSLLLVFGNWGYLLWANCKFDSHKPNMNYVQVQKKRYYTTRGSKGRTNHHYKTYITGDSGSSQCLDDYDIYHRAVEGAVHDFITNSGYFGVKYWIPSKSFRNCYKVSDFPDGTKFPISMDKGDRLRAEKSNQSYSKKKLR